MNAADEFYLDRRQLRAAFERAAAGYDKSAVLQREVRLRLLERLELMKIEPARVLDLGCGTGGSLRALRRRYPRAQLIAADLAFGMLREARRERGWRRPARLLCADALRLPLAAACVDLVFSNLMLQWCQPPQAVFPELRRVLKPHGLLLFSTFGPDTLKELRAAWAAADTRTHVHRFTDMHDLGDALQRAGFVETVMDVEHVTLTYRETGALMRELKAIGAHNVAAGRPRGLTGRQGLRRFAAAYERFRRDGLLPATYEVVYGTAWAPSFMPAAALMPHGGGTG